jgi:murein DD-endopeptidase
LYKRVFTKINPRLSDIRAVFYITKKDEKHGGSYTAAGTAAHVAGILDDGVILNSQEPYARVRRITDISEWFQKSGHEVAIRGLDRDALARLAGEGKTRYGLDPELSRYMDIGA